MSDGPFSNIKPPVFVGPTPGELRALAREVAREMLAEEVRIKAQIYEKRRQEEAERLSRLSRESELRRMIEGFNQVVIGVHPGFH